MSMKSRSIKKPGNDDDIGKTRNIRVTGGESKGLESYVDFVAKKGQAGIPIEESEKKILKYKDRKQKVIEEYLDKIIDLAESAESNTNDYYKLKYYESLAGSSNPYDIAVKLAETEKEFKEFEKTKDIIGKNIVNPGQLTVFGTLKTDIKKAPAKTSTSS